MTEEMNLASIQAGFKRQIEERSINLLFELEITPDELQYIRDHGDRLKTQAECDVHTFDLCAAYYLMDVGRRFYDDGNYWSNIDVPVSEQKAVGTFFQDTLKRYGLVVEEFNRKWVDPILMHSFIPEAYSDRFFDFVNRFYMVALGQQVPDDLDAKLQKFAEVFSSNDFTEAYQEFRSFNPIVSTKRVLKDSRYFGPLVTKMIKRLANDYASPDEVNLGVYEAPFKVWLNTLGTDKSKRLTLNENPYLQFDVVISKFNLVIPPRRVGSSDRTVIVKSSSGDTIHSSSLNISKQFDSYISDPVVFAYSGDPLDDFTVSIGYNEIYSNRNPGHIILNKHGKRKNKLSAGTNMLVLPAVQNINLPSEVLTTIRENKVITFIIGEGQKLEVMGRTYSVEKEVSDYINILSASVGVECRDQDGNRYDVYRALPTVSISADRESRFQFAVTHGLDRIYYQDYSTLSRNRACTKADSGIVMDLQKSDLVDEDGIYTIRSRGRDVHKFVVLHDLYYRFAEVEYKTNGISTMHCNYFDEDVAFDTTQGVVELPPLNIDGRELTITIEIPSRRYSFDKRHWTLFDSEEIYFRNISGKNIYIYCPELVIPSIIADMKRANPLTLDIEGKYLVADFKRIEQVGLILQYSRIYMPSLTFRCDRFKLMTIRYYASYEREGDIIVRQNSPEGTYGKLMVPGMEPIVFEESVEIPRVYGCKMDVLECYDDGLSGELSIGATWVDREFHIACDEDTIIQGANINKFGYKCDGEEYHYVGNPFYFLYGVDGPQPNIYALEMDRKVFGPMEAQAFPHLVEEIKGIIMKDRDAKRTAARMRHLCEIDRQFAIDLGEHFMRSNEGVWVHD